MVAGSSCKHDVFGLVGFGVSQSPAGPLLLSPTFMLSVVLCALRPTSLGFFFLFKMCFLSMGSIIMLIISVAALLPSGHAFVALPIQACWEVFLKHFHTVKISCVSGWLEHGSYLLREQKQ